MTPSELNKLPEVYQNEIIVTSGQASLSLSYISYGPDSLYTHESLIGVGEK